MSNGSNNWGVQYSRITFLEKILSTHPNVISVNREHDIYFTITRRKQRDMLKILCCDEYALGLAAVRRGLSEFGKIDIFFVGGVWNGYTKDAKNFCEQSLIGIYNSKEMAGGLWRDDFWSYYATDEKGNRISFVRSA